MQENKITLYIEKNGMSNNKIVFIVMDRKKGTMDVR